MQVINYEEDKYITLSFSDFCTTKTFDYEIAHSNSIINPALKDNYTISSMSNFLKWIKCDYNYLKAIKNEDNLLTLIKFYCEEGRCRKKINNNSFYLNKARDNYIEEIKSFFSILTKNKVNKKLQYYFIGTECGWENALPKAILFLKKYLNAWPDEKLTLYYQYAYSKWSSVKNTYIHQNKKGELPYVFHDYKVVQELPKINAMTTKQLRNKLINGYILCFMFNGLSVEIKPPISGSTQNYDFSQSIFINNVPLNEVLADSEDHINWWKGSKKDKFKENLWELLSPRRDCEFSTDLEKTLSRHIYNIRGTKDRETHYYTISFEDKTRPNTIQIEVLREFSKERASSAFVEKTGCNKSSIKNIHEHGT